jgi:hypothetical protein
MPENRKKLPANAPHLPPLSQENSPFVVSKTLTINNQKPMADSDYWNNQADKNKRAGWSDTNSQDREWHAREQKRAEELARSEREREERQRKEREQEERRRREDEERRNRR